MVQEHCAPCCVSSLSSVTPQQYTFCQGSLSVGGWCLAMFTYVIHKAGVLSKTTTLTHFLNMKTFI